MPGCSLRPTSSEEIWNLRAAAKELYHEAKERGMHDNAMTTATAETVAALASPIVTENR